MKASVDGEIEVREILLQRIKIGKIVTDLEIRNTGCEGDILLLDFSCGYRIKIDERGIALQRAVNRPNHDHCNVEEYVLGEGEFKWVDSDQRFAECNKKYDIARLEFGPRTVDW